VGNRGGEGFQFTVGIFDLQRAFPDALFKVGVELHIAIATAVVLARD